jgi:esterase/lipase
LGKKNFQVTDDQIFIFGRSLGTSPAIYLSSKRRPKALFVVSAFTSIKDIGADKYVSVFVEEIFNSIKYIKTVKCPILFIHGEKDPLISFQQSN